MAQYVLGLDAGNTVIKAVLFDLSGRRIAVAHENGSSITKQPGYVERDMNELWQQAGNAIAACIQKSGVAASEIAAIGCAGHGNGLYLLDKANQPLLAVQSLDNRAAKIAEKLSESSDLLKSLCLQRPWPSQTPTLLAWVKEHDPSMYQQVGTVFLCKDYINFQLTGKLASDVTDMSGCGLLKMPETTYSEDVMAAYGLSDAMDKLPSLNQSTTIVGTVTETASKHTGLSVGTPVVGGVFDVVASALGSGTIETGQASIIAGTWSINQVIVDAPTKDTDIFMAAAYDHHRFVEIEASATSAVNLEWFAHELMGRDIDYLKDSDQSIFDLCNDLVAAVKQNIELPIFHPYIYGGATSSNARGGFYGLAGWQGRGEMLYGLFEGVVFGHRQHVEKLKKNGIEIGNIILSGGGSRSLIWPQLFADILGVDVAIAEEQETGALGAAISAAIGSGKYRDHQEALANMTSISKRFEPQAANADFYERRYRLFTCIAEQMETVWLEFETNINNS